jgi:hypothetical protein
MQRRCFYPAHLLLLGEEIEFVKMLNAHLSRELKNETVISQNIPNPDFKISFLLIMVNRRRFSHYRERKITMEPTLMLYTDFI